MNKDEKTLVILTPGFPESEADSTCLPMQQNLIRALKDIEPGLNIIILSLQYPYFKKTYKWHDIIVMSFDGRNKGGLLKLLLRRKLGTILKEIHSANKVIGLLSFWYGECALIGKRFADKYGIRHYCWLLGQDAKKENKYVKRILPGNDELIALSDFIQDEFERNHGVRPHRVITPGIDTKQFTGTIKEKDIDILAAGSLIPLKQYAIFIDIIAEIKKYLPGVRAMLVGDGAEKEKLQNRITQSGLQSSITMTGELPYTEVLQLMQRARVLLHPSMYEGFVMVCLEALHAGAHVISFVKPMNKEIKNWHHVNGKEEMIQKTLGILKASSVVQEQVNDFLIEDTAKQMMELFLE